MMGSLPSRGKTLPSPSSDPSAQGRDPVALQAARGFVSLGFCDPSQTSPPPALNLSPPGTKESVSLLTSMLLSSPSVPAQARDAVREKSKAAAVALGSFPAGRQAELSLRLGEPLTIVSEDGDWWTVLSEASGREYCIPSVHAARVSHGWLYEGLSREQAEELLLLPGNAGGAFLIRESQTRRGCYSLSVRLSRPASWDRIRHYRIQRLDNGWLYISPRLTFPSLWALVDHYSELADDICCCLREPCVLQGAGPRPGRDRSLPVTVQRAPLNWDQLDSSALFSDGSAATGQASLLSEGLRESLSSYMSLTDSSLDDAKAHSRGRKGNRDCST